MGKRRRSRELAIQVLYQADLAKVSIPEAFQLFCQHFGGDEDIQRFASELLSGIDRARQELDRVISAYSENWRLERMSVVDRNILRLGAYELLYRPDIPPKVSINEAVELGKKFGTEDSGAFINGILDRIHLQLVAPKRELQSGEAAGNQAADARAKGVE